VGRPFTMVKLVNITPITMVCGTFNYSIHEGVIYICKQLITGGAHCRVYGL
jgi:hypothetical protein